MSGLDNLHTGCTNDYFLATLREVETALLLLNSSPLTCKPVFIIGAPRTGSTLLYQAMAGVFCLPYISNLTNKYFADFPLIGLALQRDVKIDIGWGSEFGKTIGDFQPSEGSSVMAKWFGGGHPSQDVSMRILDGQEEHFLATLAGVETLYSGRPLLIKNAWNCFRISYLASVLPSARFVWIRRDIAESAESDLEARYLTKGAASIWNSATPSNWCQLQRLPAHVQVVENQFEFNCAIRDSIEAHAKERSIEVWFEDFIASPDVEIDRLAAFIGQKVRGYVPPSKLAIRKQRHVSYQEASAIRAYLDEQSIRFDAHRYHTSGGSKCN